MDHLSANLQLIRETVGKTQFEFAQFLDVKDKKGGYSKDKIYSYESGKAKPGKLFIDKLSLLTGLPEKTLKEKKLKGTEITINAAALVSAKENIARSVLSGSNDNVLGEIKAMQQAQTSALIEILAAVKKISYSEAEAQVDNVYKMKLKTITGK